METARKQGYLFFKILIVNKHVEEGGSLLTVKIRMNTEIYATARVWSDVPLNGALPEMLKITAVAEIYSSVR